MQSKIVHTAVDKVVDLLFAHACAFGGPHDGFLLLAPVIDIEGVLGVAAALSVRPLKSRLWFGKTYMCTKAPS